MKNSKYVDGFVLPVPKKKLGAYQKMAESGRKLWMKHGALSYFECVGDDLKSKFSSIKFAQMAKAKPAETVMFSFIVFKSKAHRNQVNAKVMKAMDATMGDMKDKPMPFDMKRMAYGGFKTIVEG